MDITVSANVVVTVWTALCAINRLVIVMVDAIPDTQTLLAAIVCSFLPNYITHSYMFWWHHVHFMKYWWISSWSTRCYFFSNLECKPGYFGLNCSGHCNGHCERNDPCDHVNGLCPNSCRDGYSGKYCNSCKKGTQLFVKWYCTHYVVVWSVYILLILACKDVTFGQNCTLNCSSNCNGTCEHIDRSCKECWNRFCFKGNYAFEWAYFVPIN